MEKTRTERKFIPGKGWEVKDVPLDGAEQVAPAAARQVHAPAQIQEVTDERLKAVAESMGMVVLEGDDYRELLERINELELQIDHANQVIEKFEGEKIPAPAKGKGKGKKADPVDIPAAIAAAKDLDELTAIMKDVDDPQLLKAADARAEELKGA